MARHLIADFPEYYHYDSEKEFTYNGIKQGNRNPLLYKDIGADGLKTGHTDEAGYCLTASVVRDGRRIIMVLAGMKTMKERGSEGDKADRMGLPRVQRLPPGQGGRRRRSGAGVDGRDGQGAGDGAARRDRDAAARLARAT